MATVLLIGDDDLLLQTRAAVLRTISLETLCSDISSAVGVLMSRHCDVVIFCHSLPRHVCETLSQIIRCRWPSTPLLLISAGRSWEQSEDAGIVDGVTSSEPDHLIQRMIELIGRRGVRSAAAASCRLPLSIASER
jgi:DNA-binding response OmpR family regulator